MSDFVGVMDSGVGGLTVLSELRKVSPRSNYLYFADHAYCPYGTKSLSQIKSRVLRVARFLKQRGAVSLVVACNTASIFADDIRNCVDMPVYDVITPTCRAVATRAKKRVALAATDATVKSGVYQRILRGYGIETVAYPCSEFVPLAEHGASHALCLDTVKRCLSNFPNDIEALILGCTHFPLLLNEICEVVGNCEIVSCSQPVAEVFEKNAPTGFGEIVCLTSGHQEDAKQAERFGLSFSCVKL